VAIESERIKDAWIDRWFYTSMASLLVATAAIGFGPNTAGILTGRLETPPLLVHVHAAIMACWLVLLLIQAALVAADRKQYHRQLGIVSFVLVPLMIAVMAVLAITTFEAGPHSDAIAVVQVRRLILFAAFFIWAIHARRKDPESHRRMQLWATVVLLDAAILRMPWLPNAGIDNVAVAQTYQLLLMAPALTFDWRRFGRVHRAHWVALSVMVATTIPAGLLW